MREAGVLLSVSSLPSRYGVGCFSKEALEFIDFCERTGNKIWQILPLGPTGYGDSPYQTFSSFAISPYYIDLEQLIGDKLLRKEECDVCDFGQGKWVDYEKLYFNRYELLRKAYERFIEAPSDEFGVFCRLNGYWLEDYSLFMALKDDHDGESWLSWEDKYKFRHDDALDCVRKKLDTAINYYKFLQFVAFSQWYRVHDYAKQHGVMIVGDIPIYVALDSADAWGNPKLFDFDENYMPNKVAGCPPDGFSPLGQLWGNPVYNWNYHRETGFQWWKQRLTHTFSQVDRVRIDHFRGFDQFYAIDYEAKDAINGQWLNGPGYELFEALQDQIQPGSIIAEDLGFLTPSVYELLRRTGYPGMKVLEFAFDPYGDSEYMPHNYTKNCVVYTGTHDNTTVLGWYNDLTTDSRKFVDDYLQIDPDDASDVNWKMIRAAHGSVANTSIIPLQDYLGLGAINRMNTPSTLGTNWKWRYQKEDLTKALEQNILDLIKLYRR